MANNTVPSGAWPTYTVDSEGRRYVTGDVDHKVIARELHLETAMNEVIKELSTLLLKKHKDYGPKNISQAPGGAVNGLRVRMHDKLARINNLFDSGVEPENESFEDSFKDMANYAIIGLLVLRGRWDND
jgi:hypothetical protein